MSECVLEWFARGDGKGHRHKPIASKPGKFYPEEVVKCNLTPPNDAPSLVVLRYKDGHVEVRWPESPDQWSYYVSMDAAMIAAELRGYSRG